MSSVVSSLFTVLNLFWYFTYTNNRKKQHVAVQWLFPSTVTPLFSITTYKMPGNANVE
jgi:hypothetical protein